MRMRADNRGTTLLSVIVAAAILAIALTAAASTFLSASRVTKQAVHFTSASNFAEGVMERIKSGQFDKVRFAQITSDLPKLPGVGCAVDVKLFEPGLKEVTVTCSWMEDKTPHRAQFSTLVAKGRSR